MAGVFAVEVVVATSTQREIAVDVEAVAPAARLTCAGDQLEWVGAVIRPIQRGPVAVQADVVLGRTFGPLDPQVRTRVFRGAALGSDDSMVTATGMWGGGGGCGCANGPWGALSLGGGGGACIFFCNS